MISALSILFISDENLFIFDEKGRKALLSEYEFS